MSDGSTQISTSLTAETAALLVKCNPNLFPAGTITSSGDITTSNTTDTDIDTHQESQQKITSLVQSVLTKTATGTYVLSVSSAVLQPITHWYTFPDDCHLILT